MTVVASRTLRWLVLAFAFLLAAAAIAVETGTFGPLLQPHPLAALLMAGNVALIHTATTRPTARPLDVSGLGALRLTVQQDERPSVVQVQLAPGSTLWPWLLALRLRTAGGEIHTLLVLPDSVQAGQFRPLVVALSALAARAH